MGFIILENENLPESLRDKPKWVSCLAITSGLLLLTVSAVLIGVMLGYTYCYYEHRGIHSVAGNYSNIQIVVPFSETEGLMSNKTINGAIMSSVFFSRIMKISHGLLDCTMIGNHEGSSNETSQHANTNATNEKETQK